MSDNRPATTQRYETKDPQKFEIIVRTTRPLKDFLIQKIKDALYDNVPMPIRATVQVDVDYIILSYTIDHDDRKSAGELVERMESIHNIDGRQGLIRSVVAVAVNGVNRSDEDVLASESTILAEKRDEAIFLVNAMIRRLERLHDYLDRPMEARRSISHIPQPGNSL